MANAILYPTDLRDYAKSQGWQVADWGKESGLFVLSNQAYENRQLIIPIDANSPGYEESAVSVVQKLASFSKQPAERIADQVLHFRDDILRVRVIGSDTRDSALPLDFMQDAVRGIQTMLKAAACSMVSPRPHHPRLAYSAAQRMLDPTKFGQTEPGSFVIKVYCPIFAVEEKSELNLSGIDGPFVRRTVMGLWRAIQQVVDAAETGTNLSYSHRRKLLERHLSLQISAMPLADCTTTAASTILLNLMSTGRLQHLYMRAKRIPGDL